MVKNIMGLKDKLKKNSSNMQGVILTADFGFGMKYKDSNGLYLKLEIQQYDGFVCTQLFRVERIPTLLKEFQPDYTEEITINNLVHQTVYLSSKTTQSVPDAIAKLPPSEFKDYQWFKNNNWD